MSERSRPTKDIRDQIKAGQALAEAVRLNETARAQQLAAELQQRERDRRESNARYRESLGGAG